MSSTNRSNSVQAVTQSPATQSAPVNASSRQPGGRCSVTCTDSASDRHPVAGSPDVRCIRPVASRSTSRVRISTPAAPVRGLRVISWPSPPLRTEPRSTPSAASNRHTCCRSPLRRSRNVSPRPSSSSHHSRVTFRPPGVWSPIPRNRSSNRIPCAVSHRYTGRSLHFSGNVVCDTSTAAAPVSSATRSPGRARKPIHSWAASGWVPAG